jgi:hypothetical protein
MSRCGAVGNGKDIDGCRTGVTGATHPFDCAGYLDRFQWQHTVSIGLDRYHAACARCRKHSCTTARNVVKKPTYLTQVNSGKQPLANVYYLRFDRPFCHRCKSFAATSHPFAMRQEEAKKTRD